VRTLESYARYYARWSAVWEAQALLRATADIGDPELCRRFTELVDPLRFPEHGISEDDVVEVRRIKARVDAERLPRGADPATHLKLGRGGLSDVEWTVQLLQMQYAGAVPSLRTPRTLDALRAAVEADLLTSPDADALVAAWRAASGLRNAVTQVRGRPADSLPRDPRERAAVAHVRGYAPGESGQLVNDYLRVTRRARQVVERLFWG
jgi:glutamate-ammonia-ligase adenylyltransferase